MSIQAAGYVGAALIAASAAFVGLIIGKEQKTTEFRQEWINAQREDIASVFACARAGIRRGGKAKEELKDFDLAHGRMLLRENPDSAEWAFVLEEVQLLRRYAFTNPVPANVEAGCDRIVMLSTRLLKTEWNRVRAGETWFRAAKLTLPPTILFVAWALAYGRGFVMIG